MEKIDIVKIEDLELLRNLKGGKTYYVYLHDNLSFNNPDSYRNAKNYFELLKRRVTEKFDHEGFEPIKLNNASIVFEGYNHEIDRLLISKKNEDDVGLFNCYNGSQVFINNLNIKSAFVLGRRNVGIIAGAFNGSIGNSSIDGMVYGKVNAGNICGYSSKRIDLVNVKSEGAVISPINPGCICGQGNIIKTNEYKFEGCLKHYQDDYPLENILCPHYFMLSDKNTKILTLNRF